MQCFKDHFGFILLTVGMLPTFYSCSTQEMKPKKKLKLTKQVEFDSVRIRQEKIQKEISLRFASLGLVDVQKIDSRIKVDLKYSTKDNFLGKVLYDTIQKAYLNKDVAKRLRLCQDYLDSIKPGYRLVIFDAIRPVQIQREMWKALDSLPPFERGKYVSNPDRGSVHNFGAAVDITICDEKGFLLDMGAEFDDFREIAYPSLESGFVVSGELSSSQFENRKLLREVMRKGKFVNIPTEWWHFNAYPRWYCQQYLPLLLTESGAVK